MIFSAGPANSADTAVAAIIIRSNYDVIIVLANLGILFWVQYDFIFVFRNRAHVMGLHGCIEVNRSEGQEEISCPERHTKESTSGYDTRNFSKEVQSLHCRHCFAQHGFMVDGAKLRRPNPSLA